MNLVPSELHGIEAVPKDAQKIYSVGISSAGTAEAQIATNNPHCSLIATTISSDDAKYVQKKFNQQNLSQKVTVKVEDISKPLPYEDGAFDFIYARLVLHYLSRQALDAALRELYRTIKPGGQLYVVVRSENCPDFRHPSAVYDAQSGLTACQAPAPHNRGATVTIKRFFHTTSSITHHIKGAGFTIGHISEYDEQLCIDFERTQLARSVDNLIEVLAAKPAN